MLQYIFTIHLRDEIQKKSCSIDNKEGEERFREEGEMAPKNREEGERTQKNRET